MDAVFEADVLLGDPDRAHDLLRGALVTTQETPSRLAYLWRIYGRFCLRSGDRVKAAELAFQESIRHESNLDSSYLLFSVLLTSQRVKQAVAVLTASNDTLSLILRYAATNQRTLLRSVLCPDGDNLESPSEILSLLKTMVVKYRLGDLLPAVKAALPETFLKRRQIDLTILDARIQIGKKNWKTAASLISPLRASASADVLALLAEISIQQHDPDTAISLLSEFSSSLPVETPVQLLDGGDIHLSPIVLQFRLGHALLKRKRWSEALRVFSTLSSLHPLASVFAGMSACQLQTGQFGECLETAKQACALDPTRADVWGLLSFSMLQLEMWQSSERCFNLYLDRLVPGPGTGFISSWLLIELGFVWANKRPGAIGGGKAEACALQALRISGASPKVHWLLGESMVASKLNDRGVMEMLTAVQAFSKMAGDEHELKAQREQVLLRAMSLSSATPQLYETVKQAVIKHAPHLLGKVVVSVPKLVLT